MGSRKKKQASSKRPIITAYAAMDIHQKIALKAYNYHHGRQRISLQPELWATCCKQHEHGLDKPAKGIRNL